MARLLGVFILGWVAAQAVLMALAYFFPSFDIPGSLGIVMAMVAAMSSGQSYARQTGRRPVGRERLTFALLATLVVMVLSLALLWGVFLYSGVPLTLANVAFAATGNPSAASGIAPYLTIGAAVVALLTLFLCWFGFGMGAKGQIKQMARAAAKN